MKKFGFATLSRAVWPPPWSALPRRPRRPLPANAVDVVITGPSQGIDHLDWLNDIQQKPNVARPDTTVRSNP